MTIDEQIAALAPLDAHTIARLAGYASHKQLNDYRVKGRLHARRPPRAAGPRAGAAGRPGP